jgi:hypothetical protein
MSRTSKILVAFLLGFLIALGVPAAAAATFLQDLVVKYSLVALLLVLAYEGALAVVAGVAAGPIRRRLTQGSVAVDRALGRRFSRYARRFRDHMRTWQRFVDAKGLATVGEHTPELDRVFVDVGLAPRPPHQVPGGVLAGVAPDPTRRYSIQEFLDRPEPVVLAVIGAPGSGKTTLLRHVAYRAVHNGRRQWRRFPIMLALRDHSGRIAGAPELTLPQVVRASLPELPVREPDGWWDEQLHHGRCVVLLDGLDEVARTGARRSVADWIERQIMSYPKNDFVITSRPHGYRTAVIGPADVLQLLPFTDEQVRRFLRGWYLATERHATGTDGPDVEVRAEERAADLLDRLASAPALYDLAVNPLLLTMIALVHRYRSALPAGRADLYGEICQVMLWRRQEAKRLPVDLPGSGKERVLAQVAFTMMSQRVRDLPRPAMLEAILPSLRRISTDTTPEAFLADVESNGLVVEREHSRYAFAHHTIGEYLAARHIRDHGLSQVLADAAGDAWWRETTLLYVADADADPIVRACLDDGSIGALALAFDCVHSGGALAPELRARLEEIHQEAFEPGADPERRRLVASVLATRHLSQLVSAGSGGRLCPHPVRADLYRLFCQDTGHPYPDGAAELGIDPPQPVCGVWSRDALAFTSWLNTVIAGAGDRNARYRLPSYQDVQRLMTEPEETGAEKAGAEEAETKEAASSGGRPGVWTLQPDQGSVPRLWLAPSSPDPCTVTAADLVAATTADTASSPVLLELLLVSASALDRAIDLDLAAFGLRVPARVRDQTLPFAIARDLDLAHTLTHYHDFRLGREHALDLADALGFAGTFDIPRARDRAQLDRIAYQRIEHDHAPTADHLPARARIPGPDVARALADALGMEFAHTPHHERVLALAAALTHEVTFAGPADRADLIALVRGLVMGSALARALAAVHDRRGAKRRRTSLLPLAETLAGTLVRRAGISEDYRVTVALDTLADVLRRASTVFGGDREPADSWSAIVTRRLAETAEPVFTRRRPLSSVEPVILRLPALALAAEADRRQQLDAGTAFRTIAAGVTLIQRRTAHRDRLETVLLARA